MPVSKLYNVLSGIIYATDHLYDDFFEYDESLSAIMMAIDVMQEAATTYEPEDPEEQQDDNAITFIQRPKIISLVGSTSYTLEVSKIYNCVVNADTIFNLPEVIDESRFCEILMTVKFSGGTWNCTFKDHGGNTLTPLDNNEWSSGEVVQYMIRYEAFIHNWVIMQVKVGTAL